MLYSDIDEIVSEPLEPKYAIMVYGNKHYQHIEYAGFNKGQISSFKPMTQDNAKAFYESLKPMSFNTVQKNFTGVIQHKLIYMNNSQTKLQFAWLKPSHVNAYHHVKTKKVLRVKYPNLIFMSNNGSFSVFVAKTTNITNSTMLYKAPLFNVSGIGDFCWGTVDHKSCYKGDINKIINNLEHAFFNSKFSNENTTENAEIFHKCAIEGKPFPMKKLIKFKKVIDVLR